MNKLYDNLKLFFSNKLGLIGTVILVGFILVALFAPQIAPYDPYQRIGIPFGKPSIQNWLGTNDVGQDILSEVIYGTRISLLMGLLSAGVALIIGTIVGLTSGFFGGRVDTVLMRVVDISLVIPMLPLMILLAAFLGPSFWNIVIVIGVLSWASPARVIRSQVLTIKNKGYIEAVKATGGKSSYVILKHILPPTLSIIISQLILMSSRAILMESSLSFLGLGDPTQKSWGIILYYAQSRSAFLSDAWIWWILPPGLLITLLVISFAYIGNSLEQIVNPRLRR
ncbi:MAG TPA: ABC transporter permease [Clostridiales bacterium]|jgi:ABC-type dipeptide/oligopeptide/nickel transport system permease subunit|nr:ABC transporter permease [Clostridiales bacterium]